MSNQTTPFLDEDLWVVYNRQALSTGCSPTEAATIADATLAGVQLRRRGLTDEERNTLVQKCYDDTFSRLKAVGQASSGTGDDFNPWSFGVPMSEALQAHTKELARIALLPSAPEPPPAKPDPVAECIRTHPFDPSKEPPFSASGTTL